MSEDEEIRAMMSIANALEPLEDQARTRVLQWALSRFNGNRALSIETSAIASNIRNSGVGSNYETFAELFEAAQPKIEKEKALVAAYWAQVCQGQNAFGAQTLNADLKDLGHGIGNITDALSALKSDKPASILQLKKGGTSKQARKTYKLTQEGIRRVMGMISGAGEE